MIVNNGKPNLFSNGQGIADLKYKIIGALSKHARIILKNIGKDGQPDANLMPTLNEWDLACGTTLLKPAN